MKNIIKVSKCRIRVFLVGNAKFRNVAVTFWLMSFICEAVNNYLLFIFLQNPVILDLNIASLNFSRWFVIGDNHPTSSNRTFY